MDPRKQTRLASPLLTLTPYALSHVPTYNTWMQDPWLQKMTASEPLTLAEELNMQRAWIEDPDKCTFIILDTASGAMVGDVNLFFESDSKCRAAEIEVMIAEAEFRRRGFAEESLRMMMAFAAHVFGTARFVAKILDENTASLTLFEKKMGFEVFAQHAWCGETHLSFGAAAREDWTESGGDGEGGDGGGGSGGGRGGGEGTTDESTVKGPHAECWARITKSVCVDNGEGSAGASSVLAESVAVGAAARVGDECVAAEGGKEVAAAAASTAAAGAAAAGAEGDAGEGGPGGEGISKEGFT